jgi:hypothetical protein
MASQSLHDAWLGQVLYFPYIPNNAWTAQAFIAAQQAGDTMRPVEVPMTLSIKTLLIKTSFALIFFSYPICASAQARVNFSGHWRQENSASQRQLLVEQTGTSLVVITINTHSQEIKKLQVKYEIGGPPTTYTGLDGDAFRTSVRLNRSTLVFQTVEHENGNEIPQKTIWTLSSDRTTLQVHRYVTKSGKDSDSISTFVREP